MRIVFTNGVFSLLLPHHVHFLQCAADLGDHFIVAVNSDECALRLKGRRPVLSQDERAFMLASLDCVDDVTIFNSETELLNLIRHVGPDVLVKGGEYRAAGAAGAQFAKSVVYIDMIDGASTSKTLERIRCSTSSAIS